MPRFLAADPTPVAREKPTSIRFVTSDDFPPFNFMDPDGRLTGYNVELARAICVRISIPCTIQVRPFPMLVDAVAKDEADAIIAGLKQTPRLAAYVTHTAPYLRLPARFVMRTPVLDRAVPETLAGSTVAVPAESRYEQFLEDFFPAVRIQSTKTMAEAFDLLSAGKVDATFGGGLAASFWLAGPDGAGCCAYAGGPYTEPAYFGDGLTVAVKAGNESLKRAIEDAMAALEADGVLADLHLRFFPTDLY